MGIGDLVSVDAMTKRTAVLRRDAAENQERILAAARSAFDELGAAASFDEVARRANVGVATVFRRFPNRNQLVAAVFERLLTETEPTIVTVTDDPWEDVARSIRVTLELLSAHRGLLLLAQEAGIIDLGMLDRYTRAVDPLLERATNARVVRSDLLARDLAAVVLMALAVIHDGDPDQADRDRYLALLMEGLRPSKTPLPPPAKDHPDAILRPLLTPATKP